MISHNSERLHTCTTGSTGARICPHSGIPAPAEGANGSFVSLSRPLRCFVFNEIGSFVPLKKFLLPAAPLGRGLVVSSAIRKLYVVLGPVPSGTGLGRRSEVLNLESSFSWGLHFVCPGYRKTLMERSYTGISCVFRHIPALVFRGPPPFRPHLATASRVHRCLFAITKIPSLTV
jgi:hypothetical protein